MEDKTTHTEANQVKQPSTEASQNNVSDGIPKARFDEVNNKYKDMTTQNQELQAQLDKIKADQEATRQKQLEKQGEYKTLLDEANLKLEKAQTDVKAWSEYKTNKRNTLMEVNTLPTNTSRAGNTPQGEFNGYSSIQEFAMKDPQGAEKYLEQNTEGYIK